ncbi:MAG: hypothetical protein FWG61_07875 [Firmicutes bacterium]|nr:hypothetical protein [Bacillota bacterium]
MRRLNSSIIVDFYSEKGIDSVGRTYFAYVPLENMVCYAVAESYDSDNDINSAKLAVESVLTAFERNPSFKNLKRYIRYAHDQIVANSVKNILETAITVVVSDYTRIRYASCGNIKFFLLNDNAFYLKSKTQTYYQFAAKEFGLDKAPPAENKNLLQYLGQKKHLRPYVSKKIELLEESTMLFTTCGLWERLDDVEILDAYEESKPDKLISNIQELYLLTQLKNPAIRSYTLASLFVEKTFKEDTIKKKKRRRIMIIALIVVLILAIIASIVISIMRARDRHALAEIEKLDSEGIRYSNYGNYSMAYEQYEKASELTGNLKNNLQYVKAKSAITILIAERWHLYNSIMNGDKHMESANYHDAQKAYQDAQDAYFDAYEAADIHSGLMVSEILSDKLNQVRKYIAADDLIKIGEMYEVEELYQEALAYYGEAEDIVKTMGDLALRKELITLIFEADRKMNSSVEANFIRNVKALMERAEGNLNYELALQYCEFIIEVYNDLGITDNQSQEDKKRIERKIDLDKDAEDYIKRARTAVAASRYDDAIRDYETVLELYGEMDIGVEHERYRNIVEDIVSTVAIMEEEPL